VDERDRRAAPFFEPGPDFRPFDSWRDEETAAEPGRGRGSLPGLLVVVGLIGFFVADSLTGGPNAGPGGSVPVPGGENAGPVAAWFIAAGVALLLFLGAVVTAFIIRRPRRPASTRAGAVEVRSWKPPFRRVVTVYAQARVVPPPRPGSRSNSEFLRTVDGLLAAVDTLSDHQAEQVEQDLLRFAASAAPADLVALIERRDALDVHGFMALADRMTQPQLRYLATVIQARRELR
jgi:hypothetical protein